MRAINNGIFPKFSKYDKQAMDFLRAGGIQFKAVATGSGNCPPFCDDKKHVHGLEYIIMFNRSGRGFTVNFWNSYNDAKEGKTPRAYDVLTCLQKNDPGTFSDFCSEYGYNEDSRRDEKLYRAVCEEWQKVRDFFTPEEMEALQKIN